MTGTCQCGRHIITRLDENNGEKSVIMFVIITSISQKASTMMELVTIVNSNSLGSEKY